LKLRSWLLLLLFVHVLVHPWVHAIGTAKLAAAPATTISNSTSSEAGLASGDQCELCRVGHNATAATHLPQTDLLSPGSILTALHAVNYASLQSDRRLPSRAPPIL